MTAAPPDWAPRFADAGESFWQACREGRLVVQHCRQCNGNQLYPRSVCKVCRSCELEYVEVSGDAEVVSYTVIHRAPSPSFADDVPYVLAIVRLREGPQLLSTVDVGGRACSIGASVEVFFDQRDEGVALPRFRLR